MSGCHLRERSMTGVWVTYGHNVDLYGIAVFEEELEARRYAMKGDVRVDKPTLVGRMRSCT